MQSIQKIIVSKARQVGSTIKTFLGFADRRNDHRVPVNISLYVRFDGGDLEHNRVNVSYWITGVPPDGPKQYRVLDIGNTLVLGVSGLLNVETELELE